MFIAGADGRLSTKSTLYAQYQNSCRSRHSVFIYISHNAIFDLQLDSFCICFELVLRRTNYAFLYTIKVITRKKNSLFDIGHQKLAVYLKRETTQIAFKL